MVPYIWNTVKCFIVIFYLNPIGKAVLLFFSFSRGEIQSINDLLDKSHNEA
jgi:hypothetical protein